MGVSLIVAGLPFKTSLRSLSSFRSRGRKVRSGGVINLKEFLMKTYQSSVAKIAKLWPYYPR